MFRVHRPLGTNLYRLSPNDLMRNQTTAEGKTDIVLQRV
jgi:hypothetical protein